LALARYFAMPQQSNVLIDFVKWALKWLVIFAAGLFVLALLSVGVWWTWNWWSFERHEAKIYTAALNASAEQIDPKLGKALKEKCDAQFPIVVVYLNESSRTIEYIAIEVSARLPGRSTNILTYDSRVTFDLVIEPNGGFAQCHRFPVRDEYKANLEITKAIYSAKIEHVRFKDD